MVKALDDAVGTVEQALHESGRHGSTVRIVTTDNGGCFFSFGNNAPLRGNKLSLWDGGTRGTAFISSPLLAEGRDKRQSATQQVHNSTILFAASDWFATIIDIAGVGDKLPLTAVDSVSQWAAIKSGGKKGPRSTLVHHVNPQGRGKIRKGIW
eukprot:COSAG01_NODE_21872_length_881_cov_1.708440_1_plen_152_part_10